MAKFVAFKMRNGDSFYLETKVHNKRKSVLVDGGDGGDIVDYFKNVVRKDKVDVVVCTHQDSDHAKGVIAFLRNLSCDEVWLPAEWGDLVSYTIRTRPIALMNQFDEFASILREYEKYGIDTNEVLQNDANESEKGLNSYDQHEDETIDSICNYLKNYKNLTRMSSIVRSCDWITTLKSDPELLGLKITAMNLSLSGNNFSSILSEKMYDRLIDIIGHYKNIIYIAKIAIENNVKIRWFEYKEDAPLKILNNDPLIPLNSKEVFSMKKYKNTNQVFLELLLQFNLSKVNRRSLVFSTRWNNKKFPPILFTADSNLEGNEVVKAKFRDGMIITTPHHGSFNNRPAFEKIKCEIRAKEIEKTKWVRGFNKDVKLDGWYMKEILTIKGSTMRYCTKCESSHIQFNLINGRWRSNRRNKKDICICN